jgi:predicted aspartyl protease
VKSTVRLTAFLLASFSMCSLSLPLTASSANAQVAPSASDAFAKHRTFAGWTAGDGTFKSWRFTAKAKSKLKRTDPRAEAVTVAYTLTEVRRGALYHDTESRDGTSLATDYGFSGRVFWDTNENGFVVTHYEDAVRADISVNTLFDDAISTYPATPHGTAKIGDTQVNVYRVTPTLGFPVDLYMDASGAYRRAVIAPDDSWTRFTIDIEGYIEPLPGKKVIGKFRSSGGTLYEITNFQPNATVNDTDLVPPDPKATWSFGPPTKMPITVAVSSYVGRSVRVKASINGHEGMFLLDSGAGGCLIFGKYAQSVNLPKLAATSFSGINGNSEDADLVMADDLSIAGSVLHNVVMQESPSQFEDIDGILGYDVLAAAIVEVDIAGRTLSVFDPDKYKPAVAQNATEFTVDLTSRQPAMDIKIAGTTDIKPIFDTGNDLNVMLSEELRKSAKINPTITGNIAFGGVDGTMVASVPCGRISQILIGPYRYENSSVCFATNVGPTDGLVGFDFLRHFNWTFDYPDGKLILTPNGLN